MTTNQPLDLDAIEAAARNAARIGSGIHPDSTIALVAEVRRLRAQVAAVTDLCDQQEMAARMFELPTPEWITAVRNATAPTARSAAV